MNTYQTASWVHRKTKEGDIYYDRTSRVILREYRQDAIGDMENIFSLPTFSDIAPLKAYLDPSYLCNLECRHCITNSSPRIDTSDEMPTSKILSIIDELWSIGVLELAVAGGEPLIYPDILPILKHARMLGLNVLITTNGHLLTRDLARKLVELDLAEIRISFEGCKEIHDNIAGVGSYERSMEGVKNLLLAGGNPIARLTLCKGSDRGLEKLFADLELAGVKSSKICVIKKSGRASLPENEDIMGFEPDSDIDIKLEKLGGDYGIEIELEDELTNEINRDTLRFNKSMNCGAGFQTAYISPHGNVHICSASPHLSFGNLKEMSFMDAWTSPIANAYRKRFNDCTEYRLCQALLEYVQKIDISKNENSLNLIR